MIDSNIKILVNNNERLDYFSAEGLDISFNRIVDDLQDLEARFGDFTYSFDIPQTSRNSVILGFANALGVKGFFKKTQNIPCKVYNGTVLLLDGVLNLNSVGRDVYSVTLFSKFKEFIDEIEGKTLNDLNFTPIENYDYELDIIRVTNSGITDSDDNLYVYPYINYGTQFCPASVYSGHTDNRGQVFDNDYPYQCYNYTINSVSTDKFNYTYHHQMPMALFMVRVVRQIFDDAGWSLGGSFWNDSNVKKMLIPYTGDQDVYDRATQTVSGTTAIGATRPAVFLPELDQSEFLAGIISMFNLYFEIDVVNKIIKFNTYDTLFGNSYNPYDITKKVNDETVVFNYNENNNPTIRFTEAENRKVCGDSYLSTGYTNNASEMVWVKTNDGLFDNFFNRIGDGNSDSIELPFAEPTVCRHIMYNNYNQAGSNEAANPVSVYLPLISDQTPTDNSSMKFNKKDTDTTALNNEDSIKFKGASPIMFWYGISSNDFVNFTGEGSGSDYYYVNVNSGGTLVRLPIGFCSPFQLGVQTEIEAYMATASVSDRRTITGSYLRMLWTMMGNSTSSIDSITTDYSLVFDDNGYFHNTLWSKFHANKYKRYQDSEMLEATMKMNDSDWNAMQISRPILYNKEIYHIVSIEGYSPITHEAQIKLIKKL